MFEMKVSRAIFGLTSSLKSLDLGAVRCRTLIVSGFFILTQPEKHAGLNLSVAHYGTNATESGRRINLYRDVLGSDQCPMLGRDASVFHVGPFSLLSFKLLLTCCFCSFLF